MHFLRRFSAAAFIFAGASTVVEGITFKWESLNPGDGTSGTIIIEDHAFLPGGGSTSPFYVQENWTWQDPFDGDLHTYHFDYDRIYWNGFRYTVDGNILHENGNVWAGHNSSYSIPNDFPYNEYDVAQNATRIEIAGFANVGGIIVPTYPTFYGRWILVENTSGEGSGTNVPDGGTSAFLLLGSSLLLCGYRQFVKKVF